MITDLNLLLEQEAELEFRSFDSDSAWRLGAIIKQKAEEEGKSVAIDIQLNGHCLFSFAMQGSSPDNQAWIRRKQNVVQRYRHSSWYMGQYYNVKGKTMEEASRVDGMEYAPYGGSFPLSIKNSGVVGSITVSGLPQYEDHLLIVESIRQYLNG